MEEKDLISGVGSGDSQGMATSNNPDVHLPLYLTYLSLAFKLISTMITVLMAGWIIFTIKAARNLHKIHNIYVVNVLATGAVSAVVSTLICGIMMIGYITGLGDFVSCAVFTFTLFSGFIVNFTFLLMAVDKVIALTFPLRHHVIMKPRVVFATIAITWILALAISSHNLFRPKSDFTKVSQFGSCTSIERNLTEVLVVQILPVFLVSILTIILNAFLTYKAYQIHKKIQAENKLSGGHSESNNQLKVLKKEQATVKKNLKPMITLLVIVVGTTSLTVLFPILYIPSVFQKSSTVYKNVIQHVIAPNIGHVYVLLHPIVYGLYFKQVRKPMLKLLKNITCLCRQKSAAIATQPQGNRSRVAWM